MVRKVRIMNKTIDYYNKNAKEFTEGTQNVDMSKTYALFEKYLKPKATILDLGCGSGRDSKYFVEQGYNVVAIDGSKELCDIASKYIGQQVINMYFDELEYQDEFDGIWACSSLLHIENKEISSIFRLLEKALKEEGIIYASFKYGEFEGERNGRYFCDFTEEKVNKILEEINGLKIIETVITADARKDRTDEKWLNVIIKKNR